VIGVLQAPNVAVTAAAAVMLDMTQLPVPLQPAPVHPVNPPDVADAVKVTEEPDAKLALQVLPQLMPPEALVTVPEPVPALLTLTV
jgi:hypothetical protein